VFFILKGIDGGQLALVHPARHGRTHTGDQRKAKAVREALEQPISPA
jgi:hypothetical protein